MINVSHMERFATHDGPGIRTTVFLLGCPLHCPWCANPETWSLKPMLLHNRKKCVGCRRCIDQCPTKAITWDKEMQIHHDLCILCNCCVDNCYQEALSFSGRAMEKEEVIEEVMQDVLYYENSNGGVTFSGGEPLVQHQEVLEIIKELKKKGLHIAMETTGNYSQEILEPFIPYVDVFLFDIKHVHKEILYEVTGGNLDIILDNLNYLVQKKANVIIRTPVIPGFNYEPHILKRILEIAKEMGIKEVHFLPYHSLGKNKWEQLHKEYLYSKKMMDKKELMEYIEIGKAYDVCVKIGG